MTPRRNMRIILDGLVKEVTTEEDSNLFGFSRYSRPYPGDEKSMGKPVTIIDGRTKLERGKPAGWMEDTRFLRQINGYDISDGRTLPTKRYRLVKQNFDLLSIPEHDFVYRHPNLDDILRQLNIPSLTPFFLADYFELTKLGGKVTMEVMQITEGRTTSRVATFEDTVSIDGKLYLLEVKGVNFADRQLDLSKRFHSGGQCRGGLIVKYMENTVEKLGVLNQDGFDSELLIVAYKIPLQQYDGQELGAFVRAVPASPTIAHLIERLPEVAAALRISAYSLGEYIIRRATQDMCLMWKKGMLHSGPVHEQNIRIGGVTDISGAEYVREAGFGREVYDVSSFMFTCQNIMWLLLKEDDDKRPDDYYLRAREIVVDEINKAFSLRLDPRAGTVNIATQIYQYQRNLGFSDPNEVPILEYRRHYNQWYDPKKKKHYHDDRDSLLDRALRMDFRKASVEVPLESLLQKPYRPNQSR